MRCGAVFVLIGSLGCGGTDLSKLHPAVSVPDAVDFGKRWVTECLRAAYPLGHGHGPVSALFRLER